ncbi:MAG TPA: BTAD domain-containing putative transcriptional regulator [Longimicrobiales bacterium]|nr:BTAD domain-containing putative transcriptional regulator [Longimicrobiales bacterium]
MYRLRIFGGAALLRDGAPLDSVGAQRKIIALLALLAHAGRHGISRDRIAAHLWSESDMERARGALKQSLHVLRRQLGSPDVVLGTSELRLNPELLESDVEAFVTAIERGDHQRAIEYYGGPFLDGFHLPGAPEFEQWAGEQRAVLARQHAHALEALANAARQRGAFEDAAALWRRLQSHDPFNARAAVGLMEALDATGERAAALRAGQAFDTLVREELGTSADAAVISLMQRLRVQPATPAALPSRADEAAAPAPDPSDRRPVAGNGDRERDDAPTALPGVLPAGRNGSLRPIAAVTLLLALLAIGWWQLARLGNADAEVPRDDASIAVIPFVNTTDNAVDGHFADGLTDELITRLGRVEGMRVSARTSTFALRGRGLSARAFADTLGVAAVIEGTVRRQDDRLKITAQLVDPDNNSVLWSESYDRQTQDMIAVQEEIALAIVHALRDRLPTQPAGSARVTVPGVDAEAYDLYLRGRYNWDLPTRDRLERAARFHQGAVERDPSFAAAYAALAETYVNLAIYGYMPAGEALARANVSAEQALSLDSALVEAVVARAYVRLSEQNFGGAEADLRRALSINPNYPWAHHFLSLYLMMEGRPQEATRYNQQALVLDPLSLPANATRGIILVQRGDLAAAERELRRALQMRSDFTLTLYYLGVVQAARGEQNSALATLQRADRQAPDYPGVPGALAHVLRRLGRTAEADSIITALEQRAGTESRARMNLAFALGASGRTDDAIALLAILRWDVPALIGLRTDPLLGDLRSDPRYYELLRTIGAQR